VLTTVGALVVVVLGLYPEAVPAGLLALAFALMLLAGLAVLPLMLLPERGAK
jgi:hypothetical protein